MCEFVFKINYEEQQKIKNNMKNIFLTKYNDESELF